MTPRGQARRAMALTLTFDVCAAALAMAFALIWRWSFVSNAPENVFQTTFMASSIFGIRSFASAVSPSCAILIALTILYDFSTLYLSSNS